MANDISRTMKDHYQAAFGRHGASSSGVDWGADASKADLRYHVMLAVLEQNRKAVPSLLDVGCGYGGLYQYAQANGVELKYTGIDVASNMIGWAKENLADAEFVEGDILDESQLKDRTFEYVICNGILTQKLEASLLDMDNYAKTLMRRMYDLCDRAIAFNIMSSSVNYFAPNLYYKHPSEVLGYCLSELSRNVRLDHSYGLYEFTVYAYKGE